MLNHPLCDYLLEVKSQNSILACSTLSHISAFFIMNVLIRTVLSTVCTQDSTEEECTENNIYYVHKKNVLKV